MGFKSSVNNYNKKNNINPKYQSGSAVKDVFEKEQYKKKKGYVTGNSFKDSVEKFNYMEKMGYRLPNEPTISKSDFKPKNTSSFAKGLSSLAKFLGLDDKEKKDAKRSGWDRLFDFLSTGSYTTAGFADALTKGKGVGEAFKQAGQGFMSGVNVFDNKKRTEHDYNYSDVLENMGWKPKTTGGKIAKSVAGFIGDVVLDPTTYFTFGTSALLKGTGKVGKKALTKVDDLESAYKVVRKFYDNAPDLAKKLDVDTDYIQDEARKLLDMSNKLRGIKKRKGIEVELPFTNKSKVLVSGDKIADFADKLGHTKYVNKAIDSILTNPAMKLVSNKVQLREMAKNDPDTLFQVMKMDSMHRIKDSKYIDMRTGQIKDFVKFFDELTEEEAGRVRDALIATKEGTPEYGRLVKPNLDQTYEGKKLIREAIKDLFGRNKEISSTERMFIRKQLAKYLEDIIVGKGDFISSVEEDAFKYLDNYLDKAFWNSQVTTKSGAMRIVKKALDKTISRNIYVNVDANDVKSVMKKLEKELDMKLNPDAKRIYDDFKKTGNYEELLNANRNATVDFLVEKHKLKNPNAGTFDLENVRNKLIKEYDEKIQKILDDAVYTVKGALDDLTPKELEAYKRIQREMQQIADESKNMGKISKDKYEKMSGDIIETFIKTPSAKPNLPEIRKYYITDGYGFGAKQSQYNQIMHDADYNKFKEEILSNRNFKKTFIDLYLERANTSLDIMYDTDTTEIFTKLFGSPLPKRGDTLKPNHKAVVNIGTLKKYVLDISRDNVRARFGEKFNSLTREQVQLLMNLEQTKVAQKLGFNPRELNELAKPFIELTPEQIKSIRKIDGLGARQMDSYIVDKYNTQRRRQILVDRNLTLKMFDKFTQILKLNVTATSPGFHIANKLGNMFNNFLAVKGEVFNPRTNMEAMQLTRAIMTGVVPDGVIKLAHGAVYKMSEVIKWLIEDKVIDEGMFGIDLKTGKKIAQDEDVSKGLLSKMFGLQKKYYKGDWTEFVKVENNPNSINEQVDELARWLAMNEVNKKYTNEQLKDIILEFQNGINKSRKLSTKDGGYVNILDLFRSKADFFSANRGEKISYNIPGIKKDVPLISWLRKNIGKIDPTDTQKFFPYTVAGNVGAHIETSDRILHYIATLKQGGTREDAMESVSKFLFDYSDLTDFEFNVMRRIVPFYTWARKNTPLQLQQLFENTNAYKVMHQASQIPEDMVDDKDKIDRGYLDWWNRDSVQLPFATSSDKGFKENYLMPNILPAKDLVRFDPFDMESTGQKAFTQLHPILKAIIEQGTGKNVAFGGEVKDVDKYALDQIGTLKNYENIFKGATNKDLPPVERLRLLNNELTGVKIQKATPDGARRKELLDYFFNVLKPELEKQRTQYQAILKK